MEYIYIAMLFIVIVGVSIILYIKFNKRKDILFNDTLQSQLVKGKNTKLKKDESYKSFIKIDILPAGVIEDEKELVEITDSKILEHINNIIPGLIQTGNSINNISKTVQVDDEILYRAILPVGTKLINSKNMENAVRGMYQGTDGKFKGHADFLEVKIKRGNTVAPNITVAIMSLSSMIVGQYYMTQIDKKLSTIGEEISRIQNFQNNEYKSRVFSLIAHVKKISEFQSEVLNNNELRISKISQLERLKEECTKLIGQADFMLENFTKQTDLKYKEYEKTLVDAQNWFIYQKTLLDILYEISELYYTLHLGKVSREQSIAMLQIYIKHVRDTQELLTTWHEETTKRLGILADEIRRKRSGFDGVIHFIPGLFNEDFKFRTINEKIANMIELQKLGNELLYEFDTTDLYMEDVQLISKDGKIYYFPTKLKGK